MHPHVIGHRSRIAVLEELIDHIAAHPGVWFATHAEVATYVRDQAAATAVAAQAGGGSR
jgi:hypothetical protein